MLKRTNNNWSAQIVYVTESEVVSKDRAYRRFDGMLVRQVNPKSGWSAFLKHINELEIIEILKTQDVNEAKGCGGADGMQYFFECNPGQLPTL